MNEARPGDDVRITGEGTLIGKVGKLFLSVFVGDVVELADKAKRWSGWNWPPFLLVVTLGSTDLISAPDGPVRQFLWVHLAIGTAVTLALIRLVTPSGGNRGLRRRMLMSATAVLCAFAGTVGMDNLADHGEIDVTGRTRISPGTATDGSKLRLTVDSPAERSHLRLTLTITDALPGSQSCTPETSYSAQLPGNENTRVEGVRSGQAVEFPLGGLQGEIVALVTMATDAGCRMRVSVADVALYD